MISIFGGTGFIGGRFLELYKDQAVKIDRNNYIPKSNEILYFISTTDNHNVFTDPHKDIDTNLTVLINVLQNCKKGDTFNYISTWSVYGDVPLPAREDGPCNPKGFYGSTKRCAEQLTISYCETFGINYRILRLCNVLGETDKGVSKVKNATQYLMGELLANRDITLYYNGEFTRDYLYVDDVCDALYTCIRYSEPNQIINIGSGTHHVFKDVILYCARELNSKSKIGYTDPSISSFHDKVQAKNMYLDSTKLNLLGFKPIYTVWDSLNVILEHMKK